MIIDVNRSVNTQPLKRLLLVDGNNTFIRSFAASKVCNRAGVHVAGIVGFLRSINYAKRITGSTRVCVVFDGEDNVRQRRAIYPEYKKKSGTASRFHSDLYDDDDREETAKEFQIMRLIQYLKCLPLSLVCVDGYEADDVIALIHRQQVDDFDEVYIMSSDRDYFQLVDEKTKVWSPTKKKMYDSKLVYDEFGVYPHNFVVYRCIIGDVSDNIPNVRGIAHKMLHKFFPEISTQETFTIDDLIEVSSQRNGPLYERVRALEQQIRINRRLIHLGEIYFPDSYIEFIQSQYQTIHGHEHLSDARFLRLHQIDSLEDAFQNPVEFLGRFRH